MKFYHAENSNRFIKGPSGRSYTFDPYNFIGGSWFGVLATNDAAKITDLDALTEDAKSAVTAITQEEYAKCVAKKPLLPESFRNSNSVQMSEAQSAVALVVGEPVSSIVSPPPSAAVESVDDVLKVGKVEGTGNTPAVAATTPPANPAPAVNPTAKPKAAKKVASVKAAPPANPAPEQAAT